MKVFPVMLNESDYLMITETHKSIVLNQIKAELSAYDLPNGVLGAIQNRIDESEEKIKELESE